MRHDVSPFTVPAACALAGCWFSLELLPPAVGLLLALMALGLALGRSLGRCVGFLAFGALLPVAHGIAGRSAAELLSGAPAEVVGKVAGHWRQGEETQSTLLDVRRIRQRDRVLVRPIKLWVSVPITASPPPLGTELRLRGTLSRSTGYWNRGATPPGPWRMWVKSEKLLEVEAEAGAVARASGWLRHRVEGAFAVAGDGTPGSALARALVLGDASRLPERWKRGLRRWGLSHVLSVSGLHLALLAAAVCLLAFPLPRRGRLLLASLAMALYLLVVGPLAPLLRSAVMAWLGLAAWLLERPPVVSNSWGVALLGLLVTDPSLAVDLSFQLTISATAGLIFLAPSLASAWTMLPRLARGSLAGTAAAQLATLPWCLPKFHQLTPLAPLANCVGVPWCCLVLVVDLAWVVLGLISPPLARACLPGLDALTRPLDWLSDLPAVWAWPVPIGGPGWLGWVIAAVAMLLLLRPRPGRLGAGALLLLVAGLWPNQWSEPELVALDVGQGDAVLLRQGRQAWLVDGGGWSRGEFAGTVLLPALLGEGVRRLEGVVMTHADADHCRGLVDLLDLLPVREIWAAPTAGLEPCGRDLLAAAGNRSRVAREGTVIAWGRLRLRVLHPGHEGPGAGNNGSVVLRVEGLGRTVLLTGDIESEAEGRLLDRYRDRLEADLLKVAHHGSRSSSSQRFLAAVSPRWAVISVGRQNRYHHPAPEVVRRLEDSGAVVLRTDRDGAVRFALAGEPPGAASVHGPVE